MRTARFIVKGDEADGKNVVDDHALAVLRGLSWVDRQRFDEMLEDGLIELIDDAVVELNGFPVTFAEQGSTFNDDPVVLGDLGQPGASFDGSHEEELDEHEEHER